jgi:hypothetical protein
VTNAGRRANSPASTVVGVDMEALRARTANACANGNVRTRTFGLPSAFGWLLSDDDHKGTDRRGGVTSSYSFHLWRVSEI